MWRCQFIDEREEIYFEMNFECLDYLQKYLCILSKPYIHFLNAEFVIGEFEIFRDREKETWSIL